jgi:dCTP deaminase
LLSDSSLIEILPQLIPNDNERDYSLVNPASIDIRVGKNLIIETSYGFKNIELNENEGYWLEPGDFVLVDTYERICVPNGFAVDLKLKSSTARKGFNHSLAFWVDPGWDGRLTMEVQNILRYQPLVIRPKMKFAQIIVHKLDKPAMKPYSGRYQGAATVEGAK